MRRVERRNRREGKKRLGDWPRRQISREPLARKFGDGLERARFFEEVSGARNKLEFHFALHFRYRLAIQVDHDVILPADDEHGLRFYFLMCRSGQVGPATSGKHGVDWLWPRG